MVFCFALVLAHPAGEFGDTRSAASEDAAAGSSASLKPKQRVKKLPASKPRRAVKPTSELPPVSGAGSGDTSSTGTPQPGNAGDPQGAGSNTGTIDSHTVINTAIQPVRHLLNKPPL